MKNILIVDDAAFMRTMLKNILVNHGYNVVGEASNGAEAIEKYHELKPDIITMDITMPEVTGIEALEELIKADPSVKVCMVSACGQPQFLLEAIKKGAKDFITKPFTPDEVMTKINQIASMAS